MAETKGAKGAAQNNGEAQKNGAPPPPPDATKKTVAKKPCHLVQDILDLISELKGEKLTQHAAQAVPLLEDAKMFLERHDKEVGK